MRRPVDGGAIEVAVHETAASFVRDERFACLGIDVPIGLLEHAVRGGRECDAAARRLLGPRRGSSVFSPPVRAALACDDYPAALAASRASSPLALGISKQCFHLFPKIREVDAWMTPALQQRVVEVHPECSLFAIGGDEVVAPSKKSGDGRQQRLRLLQDRWAPDQDLSALVAQVRGGGVAVDDVLDAMAVCWTAGRVLRGRAERLPLAPPRDRRGLRMEIWR